MQAFSSCGAQALGTEASVAAAARLSRPTAHGSSQIRDGAHVPALPGGFVTTGQPGKPQEHDF